MGWEGGAVLGRFVNWTPSPDTDEGVRRWMKSKGPEVTGAEYDRERKIYTWKAGSLPSGHSPRLIISQQVLTDFPAFVVLEHLDRLEVGAVIRRRPDAEFTAEGLDGDVGGGGMRAGIANLDHSVTMA